MGIVVITHSADFDGRFCQEIARKKFGDKATYTGWDYGDPVPFVSDADELYMLDISIDELMRHPHLTWIDHHKTAIEKYSPNIRGLRIDGVAACRLAWQYWFCDDRVHDASDVITIKEWYTNLQVAEPIAVRLAGLYDVWDKRDPRAELFQHGLRSRELTPKVWAGLLEPQENNLLVNDLLQAGEAIQYAKNAENKSIIQAQGFTVHFEGKCFLALNAARYNSFSFTDGLLPEHDGCLGFNWTGTDWKVGMYGVPGKPEQDFTPIAVKFGGGGHRQTCGFRTNSLPFWP